MWPNASTCRIRFSPDIGREAAAVLKVNPATASLLLETYTALSPGDWGIQNAAHSAVGRALIVRVVERAVGGDLPLTLVDMQSASRRRKA